MRTTVQLVPPFLVRSDKLGSFGFVPPQDRSFSWPHAHLGGNSCDWVLGSPLSSTRSKWLGSEPLSIALNPPYVSYTDVFQTSRVHRRATEYLAAGILPFQTSFYETTVTDVIGPDLLSWANKVVPLDSWIDCEVDSGPWLSCGDLRESATEIVYQVLDGDLGMEGLARWFGHAIEIAPFGPERDRACAIIGVLLTRVVLDRVARVALAACSATTCNASWMRSGRRVFDSQWGLRSDPDVEDPLSVVREVGRN